MANDINDYGDLDIGSSLAGSLSDAFPTIQRFKPENPKEESKLEFSKHDYLGLNLNEYEPYLGTSLLPNQDFNRLRAEAQPWTSELRNALFNLPGSIVGGIVENAGYMGSLLTEWGDDRDYTNSWTEAGKGIKDWWKSNIGGEIYRKNPEKVWDTADSAWWIQNGEGLVESIGEFYVTGWGIGSALGSTANALATTMKASAPVARGLMGAAQVGTAATLAYTEGAMTGAQVYKDVYAEEYQKQLRELGNQTEAAKRAKHKAATAAATAVHLNTSINTLLNIGSIGPVFRRSDYLASNSVKATGKKNAVNMYNATSRAAGETTEDLITRVSNLQYKSTPITPRLGREALQEGVEEQVNLFAEQAGRRVGEMDDEDFAKYEYNNWSSYLNQFEQLSHFTKDVFTEEGALNFVLGAVGGIGQTGLMEYAAPKRVENRDPNTGELIKDANGNATYRWTTPRALELMNERISFNKLQDSVVGDLKRFNEKSKELNELVLNKEKLPQNVIERLIENKRQELFDLEAYRSIRNGTADYLKGTFEYISRLDNNNELSTNPEYTARLGNITQKIEEELAKPEEEQDEEKLKDMRIVKERLEAALNNPQMTQAIFEGYAEKKGDDLHVKRSENAIKQIKDYTKMYHDVMSRYNYGDEETAGLAKTLWGLKLETNSRKRQIERDKDNIERYKKELQEQVTGPYTKIAVTLSEAAAKQAHIESLENQIEEIQSGLDVAMSKRSSTEYQDFVDGLMNKYPGTVASLKAQGKSKKAIEKELIKKEQKFLDEVVESIEEQKKQIEADKKQILENGAIEHDEKLIDASKDQIESRVKQFEKLIEVLNSNIDNKMKDAYDQITKNELDSEFLAKEYAELSSSKGRKEFVENSKKFFERVKAYAEAQKKEKEKEDSIKEKKKKGHYVVEKTKDGKFAIVDVNDQVIEVFDTEEEAEKEAKRLNDELDSKKPDDEFDDTIYEYRVRANTEQHAHNVDFLNSLFLSTKLPELTQDEIDEINQPMSDDEFNDYINKGTVTDARIKIMGNKTSNNIPLSDKEVQMLAESNVAKRMNDYLLSKVKGIDSIYTMDEFIDLYNKYKFTDSTGKPGKLTFLDNYMDYLQIARDNGVKVKIINNPADGAGIYEVNKVITINMAHFDASFKTKKNAFDDKNLSELFVHETIHSFIGRSIETTPEFANDLKELIFEMGESDDLIEALTNIEEDLKESIRNAMSFPDSPEKAKTLLILRRSLDSIGYVKDAVEEKGENIGLEEFITQALTQPEFAYYLNSIPSGNISKDGPSLSIWQILKKMVLDLFNTVLNNNSKLQELNDILDRYMSETMDGFDLFNIQDYFNLEFILDPGIYAFNTGTEVRDIVVFRIEGNDVIYNYVSSLTLSEGKEFKMDKDKFFNGNMGINENLPFINFANEIDTLDFASDPDLDKKIKEIKNQNYYSFLSITSKKIFDDYVEDKHQEVQDQLNDKAVNDIIEKIKKSTMISGVEQELKLAHNMFKTNPSVMNLIINEAKIKMEEISKTIKDIDDNFIRLANLTEHDEEFNKFFFELDVLYHTMTDAVFNLIKDNLVKSTNIKELIKIREKYKKGIKKLYENYNKKLEELQKLLPEDDFELAKAKGRINIDILNERLEREFVVRLSDDDMKNSGVQYAHIIKDGKPFGNLMKIVGKTDGGYYILVPDYVNENPVTPKEHEIFESKKKEVHESEVVNYAVKGSHIVGFSNKEEIFDDIYPSSILFSDIILDTKEKTKEWIERDLLYNIIYGIRVADNPHQEAMFKAAVINMFPNTISNSFKLKNKLKELVRKASERRSDGLRKLSEDEVRKLITNLAEEIYNDPDMIVKKNSDVMIDTKALFASFLYSLKPEERTPTLGGKIRIKITKATKADKLSKKMKTKSRDNIDEKIRVGIIKLNALKKQAYNNKEEVIGIHSWEDISIDYEIKVGNDWVKIGSARNPYAYKAIKMEPHNEISRSPAHIYLDYSLETNDKKKNELIDEFNRLYSVGHAKVDKATFERIGNAWLKQKELYDAFSDMYQKEGKKELVFSADDLNGVMSFGFTGGSFDFVKLPKERKSLEEIEKNDINKEENERIKARNKKKKTNDSLLPQDVDKFKVELLSGGKSEFGFAVVDMHNEKSEEPSLRLVPVTVDGKTIDTDEMLTLPDQDMNYGRYWMVVKDATGQYRYMWVKSKKVNDEFINSEFISKIHDLINKYHTKLDTNKQPNDTRQFMSNLESIFKNSIYLTIPTIPGYKTFIDLKANYNKDGKVQKNPNGSYSFYLQLVSEKDPKDIIRINIDLSNVDNFKNSLFVNTNEVLKDHSKDDTKLAPITEDNIRMGFPNFKDMAVSGTRFAGKSIQEAIMEVFELPVNTNVFKDNRLLINVPEGLNKESIKKKLAKEEEEETGRKDEMYDHLSEAENSLLNELYDIDRVASNIIFHSKDDDFLSSSGNITIDKLSKILNETKAQIKESLKLLEERGFVIKNGKYYVLNPDFGKEIEPEVEEQEEIELEDTDDISFIDDLKAEEINFIAFELDIDSLNVISDELASNSNDAKLLGEARNILKSLYKTNNEARDNIEGYRPKKKGNIPQIDDASMLRLIRGCPKF